MAGTQVIIFILLENAYFKRTEIFFVILMKENPYKVVF